MTVRLNDLGFSVNDEAELAALAAAATGSGRPITSPHGTCVCWAPGSGVEVWVMVGPDQEILACRAHFAGSSDLPLRIAELLGDDPEDAGVCAWTEREGPPLVLTVPDLDLVRERLRPAQRVTVQMTAFAHAAECYTDEPAYWAAQENKPFRMAPGFFIPSGAFAQPARAEAAFAGRIRHAEVCSNPVTGLPFHHMAVETRIGQLDVVAQPHSLDGAPQAGGIVQGYFCLSGRITGWC